MSLLSVRRLEVDLDLSLTEIIVQSDSVSTETAVCFHLVFSRIELLTLGPGTVAGLNEFPKIEGAFFDVVHA